jgi:F420-dependent oxidoreductase-like protein
MRFGAFVPQGFRMDLADVPVAQQWDVMVSIATVAEETGFDSVWVFDHFLTYPEVTQQSTWEAWTLMAGLAEATSRVRLGQMCTCTAYRPPAYLAKVAACVDVMSGGRLEVGIGAGWWEREFLAYGYDFPGPAARIGALEEAARILRSMWSEDETTFAGDHFRVSGAVCRPRPLQAGGPPLWIAGRGERRTLRVVAEHADYANFGGDAETFLRRKSVLEAHCRDLGRDPAEITLTRIIDCLVAADEDRLAAKSAEWSRRNRRHRSLEEWRAVPALYGTPDQVSEQIAGLADLGVGYLLVYFVDAAWGDGMRVFGEQLIPQFTA